MTLGERQRQFIFKVAQLIIWCYGRGYELSLGDGYRDPRAFGVSGEAGPYGSRTSNHKKRLAIDLNLFIDGEYISDGGNPAWQEIGEVWEYLAKDINGRWGGRFEDANHIEAPEHEWRDDEPERPIWL